ncbi:MAG: Mrp/NBP35 family ATP-binding protein [Acidimicrobiia bacterium]|jgi:ATP-binding protein involved in chromosome partitioning|nr:Mrp/NBP35 family ATP-binding protein [Acidimicrobiia bacterium]
MIDKDAVRAAIGRVEDPEIHKPIAELEMLRELDVTDDGSVRVLVALTVPGCPLKAKLEGDVAQAARTVDGVVSVTVDFTVMTDEERAQLTAGLKGGSHAREVTIGSRTRVVTISSGKGGVGKSSVTTNLGVALAATGKTVGIIDADVWGFSIPKMLGIDRPPTVVDEMIMPPEAHGVRAISMDYFVRPDQAVIWRGPMLHKALEQFLVDAYWGDIDYLLIDMPPGTGDIAISMSQFLPRARALVVTTPQPTAQRVAKRAALMSNKVNQEILGVVENMSWFTGDDDKRYQLFGEGGGQLLAEELEVPLLGQVPLVPAMRAGADAGMPVSVAAPESEAAEAFRSIAERVDELRPRVRSHPELVIK